MRTPFIATLSIASLLLAACGGDGASGDQGKAADLVIEAAAEENLELDEGCVNDIASKLSDDDAKAIVDAGFDGDPDISEEGDALGEEMFTCVDLDSFVDAMVEEMGDNDDGIDADCLKDKLKEADDVEAASEMLFSAAMECSAG